MELTARLLRWGLARPAVLVVPTPGAPRLAWAAQDGLVELGWPAADSPAAADLLLCCGEPGPELAARIDRVYDLLPGPRARRTVTAAGELPGLLQGAREELQDLRRQRLDAARRSREPEPAPADMGGHDMGGPDMGGHDMGGHDMGGHGMQMDMPGGMSEPETAPDRDGLALAAIRSELGPVLPHWPAGLLAEVVLHGDVVAALTLRHLDGGHRHGGHLHPGGPGEDAAADRLDRAAAVLALAGAARAAATARRLRRDPKPAGQARLHRAVAGDRVLRWSLRGLPGSGADDLWAVLLGLLDPDRPGPDRPTPQAAAERLAGAEVSAVRLALAAAPPLPVASREPAGA